MGVQEVATARHPELSNIRNVLFGYIQLILKGMTHTSIDVWGKHSYLIPNSLFSAWIIYAFELLDICFSIFTLANRSAQGGLKGFPYKSDMNKLYPEPC